MRGLVALTLAIALIAGTTLPARAAGASAPQQTSAQKRALALLDTPCLPDEKQLAQASGTAAPVAPDNDEDAPTPSPSPSASAVPGVPLPIMPPGPGVLRPPNLQAGPSPTPPPLPTPTASPSAEATGPIYLVPAQPPTPSPTPTPAQTPGIIKAGVRATAAPTAAPSPGETLGPNDYAILGDTLIGNRTPGQPFDLDGHVNIVYQDGVLVGDHAHYDGTRYIDITGHTYIQNHVGDSTLTADSIRFDTLTQHSLLINGRGVTTQGVDHGRLHFEAEQLDSRADGFTHGRHATLTTCENPHGGYHLKANTLDITPGEKAIARNVLVFLGPLAIFYIPLLVIPLRHETLPGVRKTGLIPLVGYSDAEGFYVKARIGFGTTNQYYGYYRVEYYTKIGYGLGYVASFRRKDGKRSIDVDIFRLHNHVDNSDSWNVNFNDQEVISPALRATERFSYQGDYGPLIQLPASTSLALGLTKQTAKDTENYSFARQTTQGQSSTSNYGISDTYTFSPKLSNQTTASYTTNTSAFSGVTSENSTLHFNTDTHLTGNTMDYDLIIDRFDSTTPSGVNKLPEFLVRPHGNLIRNLLGGVPNTATFTIGEYSDPVAALATGRAEAQLNFGPALYHLPIGDFSGTINIRQDAYGTGDEKAQVEQQFTITSPIGQHLQNILSYTNQHVNGLGDEPFSFDTIGGAYKNAQEILKIYNKDIYALTLQTGTAFNMQAQPVSYQLLVRPSPLSSVIIGGAFSPGSGNGFDRTSLQISSPLGRGSDVTFATYVDWKNHMRLESKTVYLRRVIGDCYEVRVSYNEDLKTVAVALDILAFPSQTVNFGVGGQQSSIVPQSFASSAFFNGQ